MSSFTFGFNYGRAKKAGGVSYDADASAYFTENTSITSDADKNAINTFYLGLKSDGIYTKIKAMYLPIWGSAASSKWNLVNPLDTNAAFRLTFATGFTFTSSGMTGNAASAYAETYLNPFSSLTLNNTHVSLYIGNNVTAGNKIDTGSLVGSPPNSLLLISKYTGSVAISDQYNVTTNRLSVSNTDSRGIVIGSRISSTSHKIYRNGSVIGTETNVSSSNLPNQSMPLAAANSNGAIIQYTDSQYRFVSYGTGFNDTEAANFSTRVNTLMTYFGINTY